MDASRAGDVKNIDITVKEDGVYLVINNPPGQARISRMEVLSLIESYGVTDVDFIKLNDTLKGDLQNAEIKISDNKKIVQFDETAAIEVSMDRMEAYISFAAPINNGHRFTLEEIQAFIEKNGIKNVEPNLVKALHLNRRHNKQYVISRGKQPTAGEDGYLQYHFDNSNLRPKPKIMEDGTVNFRQLGLIRMCNRGDALVTSVPPKDGVPGEDVYGNPVPFSKGRPPMPIPKGKNTSISEDGKHLVADTSGLLVIQDGKIHISPCLEINGDVGNSTGDIEFNGTVTIRGNVISGFTVKATGSIEIMGVCEAATLITDENIVLGNGAQGADKAELRAGGDITSKYIEGCKVTAGGNIMADSILKSVVNCGGNVVLSGKNGLLVGGTLLAGGNLTAKTIGSPMGTSTEIEVGNNPQDLVRYKELTAEFERLKKEYERVDQAVDTLNAMKRKDQLSDDKKTLLLKMINAKMGLRTKMTEIKEKSDAIAQMLTSNSGLVSASRSVRPGVRVSIGNAQMIVRDEMQNCSLRNDGEKIVIGPALR